MNCSHCGREVNPTIHSKEYPAGYKVDYYKLITGDLRPKVMQNPRDESEQIEFFKLENPRAIITCTECFADAKIQAELAAAFSEVPLKQKNDNPG